MTTSSRSFFCLNIAAFFGAFNDNALKVAVCLLALQWIPDPAQANSWIAAAGAAFVVPYLLFSMPAGTLADRFSKRHIFVLMQWTEIALMLFAAVGLARGSMAWMLGVLFLTGMQSALFSPTKLGMLPELFPQGRLAWANGVMEMVLFAGILLGTLGGSFAVDLFGNTTHIAFCLAVLALCGAAASLGIGATPAADPARGLRANPVPEIRAALKHLQSDKTLLRTTIAAGYFWFAGALMQLNVLSYAKQTLRIGPQGTGFLLGALAVGVGLGSYVAGRVSGKDIGLQSVRIGSMGMALLLCALCLNGSFATVLAILFLLGLCGGGYVVPLMAAIQARSPADEKGRILAWTNVISFSGILLASAVLWILGSLASWEPSSIFLVLGLATGAAAILLHRGLPLSAAPGKA